MRGKFTNTISPAKKPHDFGLASRHPSHRVDSSASSLGGWPGLAQPAELQVAQGEIVGQIMVRLRTPKDNAFVPGSVGRIGHRASAPSSDCTPGCILLTRL